MNFTLNCFARCKYRNDLLFFLNLTCLSPLSSPRTKGTKDELSPPPFYRHFYTVFYNLES